MTDVTSPNYLITQELKSTFECLGIKWLALRNNIQCMAQVIQLAFSAFMSSLSVKGSTMFREAYECDHQFGESESIDNGKSQTLRSLGNAGTNKVSTMRCGATKIIEKLHILLDFETSETDLHVAVNACGIDYADTWSSKWVHWLAKRQCMHHSKSCSGCENTVEFNIGVAWASLPNKWIRQQVAHESKKTLLLAALHNTQLMVHRQYRHGSLKVNPILDPMDVKKV